MTNPFLFPILACCLSGLFLALSLYLLTKRRQIVSMPPPPAAPDLTPALNELRARLTELEQAPRYSPDMPINLNRRGQVLRLLQRGDQASEIASTLGISQGEVLLMLKVHQLSHQNRDREGAAKEGAAK
ncbi:MAG TPA: hypothetical protein VFB14_19270 [Bryobacteraceae bacterium]|jgi:hypothetical protein|nr:hypothetical protein [Bryobacteraceae bacterium]